MKIGKTSTKQNTYIKDMHASYDSACRTNLKSM